MVKYDSHCLLTPQESSPPLMFWCWGEIPCSQGEQPLPRPKKWIRTCLKQSWKSPSPWPLIGLSLGIWPVLANGVSREVQVKTSLQMKRPFALFLFPVILWLRVDRHEKESLQVKMVERKARERVAVFQHHWAVELLLVTTNHWTSWYVRKTTPSCLSPCQVFCHLEPKAF